MATDYAKLAENLNRFYDFADKVVLFIGAGGKQLLSPSTRTRKMIAVDKNADALVRTARSGSITERKKIRSRAAWR